MNALQIMPASKKLCAELYSKPRWNDHAGLEGAFVAESLDGQTEAIAEPVTLRNGELVGWRLWLVRLMDGETLWMEDVCVS